MSVGILLGIDVAYSLEQRTTELEQWQTSGQYAEYESHPKRRQDDKDNGEDVLIKVWKCN